MKFVVLSLLAIVASTNAHATDVQKFDRQSLIYFTEGPGDFAQPWMKDRCNEAEQAQAKQAAEEAAKEECEKAQGTKDCLVKFSNIVKNGSLNDADVAPFGVPPSSSLNGPFGYWGCVAEALVYGLSD
jgi:hypothetical protein